MRIKRSLPIIVGVLAVAAAVALVVVLRKHAPPEPARLLPGADGFAYVNLQWMRRAHLIDQLPPVSHDPEYQQFIQATGFDFERDLEQAAIAVHYPTGPSASAQDARFSYVFVAKIDGERLRAYLKSVASSVDNYRSIDIYNIPLEGRTGRVAILGVDTVAASNHPDPQVIRGIVDRSRKLASPFGGPALLRQYYKHVPLASLAWSIFRITPRSDSSFSGPASLAFLFSRPAVVLASLRYLGAVHFKGVAYTDSEIAAKQLADHLGAFLDLFHAAQSTTGTSGTDADVKALFDSLKVEQDKDRATVTATVPTGFIQKLVTEGPEAASPPPTPPTPTPAPSSPAKPKKHK